MLIARSFTQAPRRRGAAAVEFAAVLPLLVLLIIGIWEVGRLVDMGQVVNNAAREGARQASTGGKPMTDPSGLCVEEDVKNYLRAAGVSNVDTVVVTYENMSQPLVTDPRLARQGDRFVLTVRVPIDSNQWSLASRITPHTQMITSAEWRCMLDLPISGNSTLPVDPVTN